MHIKVHDGTVSHGDLSLCTTCRHSIITRGRALEEELVFCRAIVMHSVRVTFKVTSCSGYADQRQPTYMELLEDAWILEPGSKKRPAGFTRARDLREEELTNMMRELHQRTDE